MISLIAAAAILTSAPQSRASTSAPINVKHTVTLYGQMSRMPSRRWYLLDTQEKLDRVWARHTGEEAGFHSKNPAPKLSADMIALMIFEGPGANSMGVDVKAIAEYESKVVVRYASLAFQTAGNDGGGVHCNTWGLIFMPRTTKPIEFQKDVNNIIGQDPEWKPMTTLQLGKKMDEGASRIPGLGGEGG